MLVFGRCPNVFIMSLEHGPKGRRSKGAAANIRRQKAEARRTGRRFDAPPLQVVRTPEQRTDWDEVVAPRIKELEHYPDIAQYMPAIKDYWEMRRQVTFEGLDPIEGATEFEATHPNLNLDHTYEQLRPAFEIITGRFKQVTNQMDSRRR